MILTSVADRVATITIDSPETLNAISFPDTIELASTIAKLGASEEVDVLVLTGAGGVFSSGADLRVVGNAEDVIAYVLDGLERSIPMLADSVLGCPVPVIAAVNGPAIGGAVGYSLLADVTIATRSAYFQLAQVPKWGIAPDMGGSYLPVARIGRARALGFSTLGERLSADEAAAWGLIWRSVADEDFAGEVDRTARQLAKDPEAVVTARALVDGAPSRSLTEGLLAERNAMEKLVSRPRVLEILALLAMPPAESS
jgi:2-(1,2-epoxy-1,2-dihydrophenyl)acetyl-CoA isomerase